MWTLKACLAIFAAALRVGVHTEIRLARCCSPVTDRRLKHAAVREKCPRTRSHGAPLTIRAAARRGLQVYKNRDGCSPPDRSWAPILSARCKIVTQIHCKYYL